MFQAPNTSFYAHNCSSQLNRLGEAVRQANCCQRVRSALLMRLDGIVIDSAWQFNHFLDVIVRARRATNLHPLAQPKYDITKYNCSLLATVGMTLRKISLGDWPYFGRRKRKNATANWPIAPCRPNRSRVPTLIRRDRRGRQFFVFERLTKGDGIGRSRVHVLVDHLIGHVNCIVLSMLRTNVVDVVCKLRRPRRPSSSA